MANPSGGSLLVIERLLRDRDGVWQQIIEERQLKQFNLHMLASSALSLALYGAVLGASNGWLQAVSSFVKLPLLFLATLAICLPTLYLFNLVFGARLSVMQSVTLIMVTITVTSVLTLAFAPISLFFLVTAQSYAFFKLLNVAILVLAAVIGLRFLTAGMAAFNEHQVRLARAAAEHTAAVPAEPTKRALATMPAEATSDGPVAEAGSKEPGALPGQPGWARQPVGKGPSEPRSASMALLYIWIMLFGFVGTQLAWTLRPFFGSPGKPFAVFREVNGTFYGDILSTIGRLVGA